MHRSASIVVVTPAHAAARGGNWQTAQRWARMLARAYRVRIAEAWTGGGEELMIALHARRSAASIASWRAASPRRPLLLVLTGTDLYRDIAGDASAQASLAAADALVVLNELGPLGLPEAMRAKCRVVLQSCPGRQALAKSRRRLRALMVGHLRDEKDPLTYLRAAARLADRTDIALDHIGAALTPELGAAAAALAARQANYRWLGALPHGQVLRRIQRAHVLVHPSRIEGGAHVVIEALRSGTPVLASRIDGNVGLLGADWGALFEPGDAAALAALIAAARDDRELLPALQRQLALRAPRFAPEAESAALLGIVAESLAGLEGAPA